VQTYLYGVLQIAKDHGLKKLALIGPDTAFSHALVNAVPEVARGFGQAIVLHGVLSSARERFRIGDSRR